MDLNQQLPQEPRKLALVTLFPTWREHGVTKELVVVLTKRRDKLIQDIQSISTTASIEATQLRILGVQLSEINKVIETVNDIQKFVEKLPA